MNKTLKIALSAVLGIALVAPAFAQNQFPDVEEGHWAYGALANLKDKCLFGYPDGFYRGSRMMSRYEFAVAIDKCWKNMMAQFDALNSKITRLEGMVGTGGGDNGDMAAIKKQLADLKASVDGMKGWGTAIADLQKLSKEFERDLADLGVDVNALKRDVADIKKQLDGMGKGGPMSGVNIGADVDLLVLAGHSVDNRFGLLPDGTILGEGSGSYTGAPVGMQRDMSVLHQGTIKLSGGKEDGVSFKGALVVGNLFDSLGNESSYTGGSSFSEGNTDVFFQEFNGTYNTNLVGQGIKVTLGRVGHQAGKYIWKRTSYTSDYFKNEYRDNGNWYFDGGVLDFAFGNVSLKVFGGRNSDRNTTNGTDINPQMIYQGSGPMIDQTLGVSLGFNIGENGGVNLAYLWQDADTNYIAGGVNNRRTVFGGDANFKFNNIHFYGSYAMSNIGYNTNNNPLFDNNNTAWEAGLMFGGDKFSVGAGYRTIEGRYAADGSWGRMGTWWNPRNVQGFNAHVMFNPSEQLKVWASGELLERAAPGEGGFLDLGANDQALSIKAGVKYMMNDAFSVGLKYEDVKFDYAGAADPYERWYTLTFGYNISSNSMLTLNYIYSDVDGKGRFIQGNPGGGRFTGGLLSTQLSLKF